MWAPGAKRTRLATMRWLGSCGIAQSNDGHEIKVADRKGALADHQHGKRLPARNHVAMVI